MTLIKTICANPSERSWICCQLGAREHYAVPRALQLSGSLGQFITDVWIRPGRFHPDLARANVTASNVAALTFELRAHATRATGWKLIQQRNQRFQRCVLDHLSRHSTNGARTVFAYSYAAGQIFKFAHERGWRTVLGQIDAGPAEERIVARLHENSAAQRSKWKPAPPEYWHRWRTECGLADHIIVNSSWSRDALLDEGIPAQNVRVIPLVYDAPPETRSFERRYPSAFTSKRPLRVLFLGQINLRKGVGHLLEAIKLMVHEPVEFWFVGPTQVEIPSGERIKCFGVVPRVDVARFYKKADVFVLPTLSDGFALTQLEAQAWKLPVVVSRYCGEVIQDGINGVILQDVSGHDIAEVLREFLEAPETLAAMSASSRVSNRFSLETLAASLGSL